MKNRLKTISTIMVFILISAISTIQAQTKYTLSASPTLKIDGGSSLHDWTMTTNTAKGEALLVVEGNQLKGVKSASVSAQAESLKSGTKGLDNNAYKALDTSKNKEIRFTLKEITGSGSSFQAKGDFTIAGVTKPASFPVKVTQSGNKFTFEGSFDTKLTTFSITPPTALMGTVKTRDEVKISFKTTFQPIN
ncbi:YceI family protein [Aquiflexum gelatinilyticum]|uniref:YceI family protein n=1 Tax=Aquiflexum gelatinilyticum TaxID=2961943 RepID=A0A9X2P5T2_9BACT|nr:YceI family protein [Aquiflexum gelatinilyticum]MCR9014818.1 YceI family protein [Aquiflexum gelatinilyticum]